MIVTVEVLWEDLYNTSVMPLIGRCLELGLISRLYCYLVVCVPAQIKYIKF